MVEEELIWAGWNFLARLFARKAKKTRRQSGRGSGACSRRCPFDLRNSQKAVRKGAIREYAVIDSRLSR